MANEHHSNPIVSVLSGFFGGVYAFVQTNGFLIENGLELLKVIVFGVIGGMCGYVGKHLMERFIKKAKDNCKTK